MADVRTTARPRGIDLPVPRSDGRPQAERVPLRGRIAGLVRDFRAAPERWQRFAFATFVGLAVLLALGAVHDITGEPGHFSLRGEIREALYIPVVVSWAILLSAALASALRALWGTTRVERLAWVGVAGSFGVMGFDELLMIHENLEWRTGIDWQLLYLPVFAVGGVAWLLVLLRMRRWSLEQVMWIGGAGLWFVSQIFEKLEYTANDVAVDAYVLLDGIEKFCQFTGSAMFMLVATLGIARIYYSRGGMPGRA